AVYGWLVVMLLRPLVRGIRESRGLLRAAGMEFDGGQKQKAVVTAGLLAGAVALLATNVFSPYLNHPLGIGTLMLLGALGCSGYFDAGGGTDGSARSSSAPAKSL
ncbi:MAG TPA: hypothetical protein VLC10_02810, partial [Patescibacteria group bacterium]|nr:hypothetical protein [Patescibacteria group bacterium]